MAKQFLSFDDEEKENARMEFNINETYAKRFEHNKRREELQKLESKYGSHFRAHHNNDDGESELEEDSESTDSESDVEEDETGELMTPELDAQILKTISNIRAQKEEIYDPNTSYFTEEQMKKINENWKNKIEEQKRVCLDY